MKYASLNNRTSVSSRGRILIAVGLGLAISSALFQDFLILTAFSIVSGVLLEEALWIAIVTGKPSKWFQVSRARIFGNEEVFKDSEILYTDDASEFEFYLIRRVTSGILEVSSDIEFLKFARSVIQGKEKVTKIKAEFKTHFSGEYAVRNFMLRATSPLKLFRRTFSLPVSIDYKVYPRTVEVAIDSARLFAKGGIGETPIERPGIGTEFYELRKYSVGDDYRQINWKASARVGEFIVNEKMKEVGAAYYIVLDGRAETYYDRDRLAAAFLQLANSLVALNTRFGLLIHDDKTITTLSRLDAPQNTLSVAFGSALEFVEIPLSAEKPLFALGEMREELMSLPFYKLGANERWLSGRGLTLLARIERSARASLRESVREDSDPFRAVLNLVWESQASGESKPPSILYVTAMKDSLSKIVELGSEIQKIYDSEFVLINPTSPWVVAESDDKAYELFLNRKKNLKVLANAGIKYYVGDPVVIAKNLFG